MTLGSPRRWTIYVCPECNTVWDNWSAAEWCEGDYDPPDQAPIPPHPRRYLERVEVVEVRDA